MIHRHYRYIWIIVLLLCQFYMLKAQDTPFDRKREWLINEVMEGRGPRNWGQRIWVWLEKLQAGEINGDTHMVKDALGATKSVNEVIHDVIRAWGTPWFGEGYPPYGAWRYAEATTSTSLIWVLYKYHDVIAEEDSLFLEQLYHYFIHSYEFGTGTENSQLQEMVGRYLYAQYHPSGMVGYSTNPPPNDRIYTFTWEGRTYKPGGGPYNVLAISRDWLMERMMFWSYYGNPELDSPNYTWAQIHGFITLYEFAIDPVMKRKAKMMVDFILLESVLDFVGNQWGGVLGRTYEGVYRLGMSRFYWDCFWDAIPPDFEPEYNILFSSYRIPDVIYDIGDLSDEPDNYYHINKEYNVNLVHSPQTGKWNYVTKFFSLGGRLGQGWQLCITSDDETYWFPGRTGVPFRVWLNTRDTGEDVTNATSYEDYLCIGELGYQYQKSMFVRGSKYHAALGSNEWDEHESIGYVRFFKEGRTMLAVIVNEDNGTGGLEVAIEGLDYASFNDFKAAASGNYAGSHSFVNSHGDEVSYWMNKQKTDFVPIVKRYGESDWEEIWDFPFPRVEAVDHMGRYMVRWDWGGVRMIVTKHGKQMIYDFQNWTVSSGDAPVDTTPPARVTGVNVSRGE